jgi:TPR repeat protein
MPTWLFCLLELAYCYEVGNGVKRSSRNAAKYYRMACAQGIKMMGYQWIWKEKVGQC